LWNSGNGENKYKERIRKVQSSLQNIDVMRDGHRYAMVFVFPFCKQLEDLVLSDFTVLGDLSKLCVNVNDTMGQLFISFVLFQVMSVEWYCIMYN
jgi:hypothetical protein